jgi:hypothetical protein
MRTTSRGIGFPATGTPSAFQPEPPVLLRPPSSSSFDEPSSSRELSASCRVLRQPICPSCLNLILRSNRTTDERLPWGLRPSSRHQPAASTIRQESRSHRHVPSSAFLTPSTVCSATSLCGLVSSRCHVQGLPYRGLSLTAEPCGVSPAESCPRVVERTRLRFDPRQQMRPRLQGLAPRAECGADRGCLDPDRSAPLMGFCSSGYSLHATWQPLQAASALELHCEEPPAAAPRRFAAARIGFPGIRLPTRSSFPA